MWKVWLVLLVSALSYASGLQGIRYSFLTKPERDRICTVKECIWLNDHLARRHGLPLHISMCCQCPPKVLCYDGPLTPDTLILMWDRLTITIEAKQAALTVTYGNSSRETLAASAPAHKPPFQLSPYGTHCVALKHTKCNAKDTLEYSVDVDVKLELWLVYPIAMAVSLFFLFTAPSLSRNIPLIYGTGVSIGILASVLILVYILSRYIPGKNFVGLTFLAGGYSVVGGVAYWFFNNMMEVMQDYWHFLLAYVVVAGLISFAVIYYWGGVSNPRAFDLIQWTLQLLAVLGIYMSTRLTETSLAILLLALVTYWLPLKRNPLSFPFLLMFWLLAELWSGLRALSPGPTFPPRRFLTQEEYEEQGRLETERELQKLRKYCEAHEEEVMEKLGQTSWNRLRRFINGTSGHVPKEEEVNHDWTFMEDSDTDSVDNSRHSVSPSPPHPPPSRHASSFWISDHSHTHRSQSYHQHPSPPSSGPSTPRSESYNIPPHRQYMSNHSPLYSTAPVVARTPARK